MRPVAMLLLLATCGCSAQYWGGEDAGRTPGVHVLAPSLFSRGEVSFTGEGGGKVRRLMYRGSSETQPAMLEAEGVEFSQSTANVLALQTAKLEAIAAVQRTQVEYLNQMLTGIRGIVAEIVPVLKLLAAARIQSTSEGVTLTLPGGFQVGRTRMTEPADVAAYLAGVARTLETAAAPATQPTAP